MSNPIVEPWFLPEPNSEAERATSFAVAAFKVLRGDSEDADKLESFRRCKETLRLEGFVFVSNDKNHWVIPVDSVMEDGSVEGPYKPDLVVETQLKSYVGPPVALKDMTMIVSYQDSSHPVPTCRSLDCGTQSDPRIMWKRCIVQE